MIVLMSFTYNIGIGITGGFVLYPFFKLINRPRPRSAPRPMGPVRPLAAVLYLLPLPLIGVHSGVGTVRIRAIIYLTNTAARIRFSLWKRTTPTTLLEAVRYFKDPDICLEFMVNVPGPEGVICPTCGSAEVGFLENAAACWKCKNRHPKQQFSAKVGTIFEDSPVGLDKWLLAMWMLANCKNGVRVYENSRATAISQKSTWFMLQRIRLAMQGEHWVEKDLRRSGSR